MEQTVFSELTNEQQTEFLSNLISDSNQLPDHFHAMPLAERKNVLKALLKSHCEVTFTKVDGSIRTMPCTLRIDSIPVANLPIIKEDSRQKKDNVETVSVWCLDKQSWRSFKIQNIISIKLIS